jgi:hypothetical protein
LDKDEATKVSVPGNKEQISFSSDLEQLHIFGLTLVYLRHWHRVMPEATQKTSGHRVHILVEEKSQAATSLM